MCYSELKDSMDLVKDEINVESTIIEKGTTKRDRDQHKVTGPARQIISANKKASFSLTNKRERKRKWAR